MYMYKYRREYIMYLKLHVIAETFLEYDKFLVYHVKRCGNYFSQSKLTLACNLNVSHMACSLTLIL